MDRKRRNRIICILLALLLLTGCTPGTSSQETNPGEIEPQGSAYVLKVYSQEKYKASLQQVFSHINLVQSNFCVSWTEDFDAADIVIVNHLPFDSYDKYQVVDTEKLQAQGIGQLAVSSPGGVIGVPLFLCVEGFWYDRHLYDRYEVQVPQSMDSWQECSLRGQYPILCDQSDMEPLFWSVLAPYYLKAGGTARELSEGTFQKDKMLEVLGVLEQMRDTQFIQLSEEAWRSFTSMQSAFWIAGVDDVAAYYNHSSNRSSWHISPTLAFDAQEQTKFVLRADVLAVKKETDKNATDLFLEQFFDQHTLADLSAYSRMPIACRVNYSPDAVHQLPQKCYTMLSTPMIEIVPLPCLWTDQKQETVSDTLLTLMEGKVNAEAAADAICA